MAQTLEHLSRKNDTLASIRGIVHTMKTLSAINAAPYEQAAQSIELYQQTLLQGLAAFVHRTGGVSLLTEAVQPNLRLLVVFGSDHGLCGNYNELLANKVAEYTQAQPILKQHILCIGSRMANALLELGFTPDVVLMPPASADGVGRLAGDIVMRIERLGSGQSLAHLAVNLVFTQRAEHGYQETVTRNLLPLDKALLQPQQRWNSRSLPDYTMDAEALLASLIRNHVFASVFRASAEAMVTENATRLALMQQAEQSVDEQLEAVQQELSSVRQDEITNELMDIVIGHLA
ncbi:F0F1 ATP synthase subunit gamma [Denitrificimonas caeni]|uniref:F0F1 ATP synthase subunit gamma n=1 Tax=Denitrificimonas caeni TaxID=521720 RepID=UPI0003B527D7|nr:FoF1 ATP synthase subunit gamma [Denitrificimonas caeni]